MKNEQWTLYNLRNGTNLAIVNKKNTRIIDERLYEERRYADNLINKLYSKLQTSYIKFFEELAEEAAEKLIDSSHLGNSVMEIVHKNKEKILAHFADSLLTKAISLNQEKENK